MKGELELLDEALDEVEVTPEQVESTMTRQGIVPAAWAAQIRARVAYVMEMNSKKTDAKVNTK